MDFKKVTITTPGYSIEEAHKAMLQKAIADFPQANDAAIAKMLGVSGATIGLWCKRYGIERGPKLSKRVLAAMQLLKGKGFTIVGQRGVLATMAGQPERRGGPRGRKKTYVPFESLEAGGYITVPNLSFLTVKNYGIRWLKEQPDPTIKFRFAEDAEGVKVFRTQ